MKILLCRSGINILLKRPAFAEENAQEALSLAMELNSMAFVAWCAYHLGIARFHCGDYMAALYAFEKAEPASGHYVTDRDIASWVVNTKAAVATQGQA